MSGNINTHGVGTEISTGLYYHYEPDDISHPGPDIVGQSDRLEDSDLPEDVLKTYEIVSSVMVFVFLVSTILFVAFS